MTALTHAGLFEGYGGTTMAAELALGPLDTRWVSDIKPASVALLAHRHPGVPNLGDMTAIVHAAAPRVDVLTASWPCFTGGTVVLTARGTVPITDVRVGDLVLTHRNRWRAVLHTGSRLAPTREVRTQGAPPVRTTDEHPFYVRTHRTYTNGTTRQTVERWGEPEWRPAAQIHGMRTAIPAAVEQLPEPAWPLTPWLVGRWVADGWAETSTRRVKFAVGDDKAEKFRAELTRAGVTATEYQQDGCVRFTVGRTDIGTWLVEHFGHGAPDKRIPGWLLASAHRAEWLDGYLSGDGHEHAGASWAVTVSRPLAVGVAVLGATLGLAPQVKLTNVAQCTEITGREVRQRPWYRVGLRLQVARQCIRWADGAAWGLVRSSETTGAVEQVWNLHVEEDNSYTADGLVVHNCQPHSSAGKRLGEADPRALWPHVARAVAQLRPAVFLGENVARVAGNGELRRVVRALAGLGYVGAWRCVRASDVGAPHRRDRCFVVAVDPAADAVPARREGAGTADYDQTGRVRALVPSARPTGSDRGADLTLLPTPRAGDAIRGGGDAFAVERAMRGDAGRQSATGMSLPRAVTLLPTPKASDGAKGGPGMRGSSGDLAMPSVAVQMAGSRWGIYAAAIERGEHVLGRPAPDPTMVSPRTGKPQLAPRFVEWMMGLPEGWVCDVPGLTRAQMLSLLGDGVVPQQGAYAFRFLLDHLTERLAAERAA